MIAVVYFSRDNNTKAGAEFLAASLEGTLVSLVEEKRSSFMGGAWKALRGKPVKLKGEPWQEVQAVENIYLMTPIWANNGAPAINEFLLKTDFSGKKVTIITFQADASFKGSELAHQTIAALIEKKGGMVLACHACHGARPSAFAGKEYIERQVAQVTLQQ